MGILTEESTKEYVRRQIFRIVGHLDDAHALLDNLYDSFDFDDVRQDDFCFDAQIEEHLSELVVIMTVLGNAVRKGSLLDEHFDREVQS